MGQNLSNTISDTSLNWNNNETLTDSYNIKNSETLNWDNTDSNTQLPTSKIINDNTVSENLSQLEQVAFSATSNKSESLSEFNNIFKGGGNLKNINFIDSSSESDIDFSESDIGFSESDSESENINSKKYDYSKTTSDNSFSLKGLNNDKNNYTSSDSDSDDLKISYSLSSINIKNDNYGKLLPNKNIYIDQDEYNIHEIDDDIYRIENDEDEDDEYGSLNYNINFEGSESDVSTFNTSDIEVVSVNSGKRFL